MMPRFFIIGAPKCGTTSLARWLSSHVNICFSAQKEPHFFCTDLTYKNVKSRTEYDALFSHQSKQTRALGEGSTWYLYSDAAVPNILAEFPDAKFIVMTRDPAEMAMSLFFHNSYKLHETAETFEEAWKLQKARAEGKQIPKTCREPQFLQYASACALGSLLERARTRIPEGQLMHLPLEAVKANPRAAYLAVLSFLDLPDDGRLEFPVENEARRSRSALLSYIIRYAKPIKDSLGIKRSFGIIRANAEPLKRKDISENFKKELRKHFENESKVVRHFQQTHAYLSYF